jgi:hypothetical protein
VTLPATTGPHLEITPSPDDYDQLCRDLAALRAAGAPSNTAAVIEAVHLVAGWEYNSGEESKDSSPTSGRYLTPPDRQQE